MADLLARLKAGLADRYRVDREIGRGGMAHVFLAQDLKLDRPVALKVLRPDLAAVLGGERFLREITLAAKLEHPHILGIHDSGEADGCLYYVMPYVEGESLRDRLTREKQLPVDDALQISGEVADALSYAHSRGVIHRDIKPENILLEAGHAVVADFGIALAIDRAGGGRLTGTGVSLGTPAYMSPEQAAGSRELDGRADVYALGCVVYEMLAGDPPYQASTAQALLARKLSEPPPRLSIVRDAVPPGIEAALAKALARHPADRFATAQAFGTALRPDSRSAGRSQHRRRRVLFAAALAVAALAGALQVSRIPASQRATVLALLRRPAAATRAERILVAAFSMATEDSTLRGLGDLTADWIGQGLVLVPGAEVVDAGTTYGIREIVDRIPWPLRARDKQIAMAEEARAGTLVTGTIHAEGDTLVFLATITDVARERRVRTLAPVRGSRSAPSGALTELRDRVAGSIGQALQVTGGTGIAPLADPPSLEAFQEVARGWEAYLLQDDTSQYAHLARAIRLDSSYTTPRVFLALVRTYAFQYAIADAVIRDAEHLRAAMPPAERALLDHLKAFVRGDREEALRAGERFAELMPGSDQAPLLVASNALSVMRPDRAQAALARVDPDRGLVLVSPMYRLYRAMVAAEFRDWEGALARAQTGLRRFPESVSLRRIEVQALARLGRVREMEQAIERLSAGARPLTAQAELAVRAWGDLRAANQHAAASRLLDRYAQRLDAAGSDPDREALFVHGTVLLRVGRPTEARAIFAALVQADTGLTRLHDLAQLGIAHARLGDRAAAERAAAEIAAADVPWGHGIPQLLQATIVAALNERDRAVQLLQQGLALGLGLDKLGGALFGNPDLEPLFGYEPFEILIRPVG